MASPIHMYNGILFCPLKKKKEILPFLTTWMDLKSQVKSDEKTQILYDLTYMWNLKTIKS